MAERSQDRFALMWSGGKDAMLALDVLHSQSPRRIEALVTTVVEEDEQVTMHGTPLALVERQAEAMGIPLHVVRVRREAPNDVYEARLTDVLRPLVEDGFSTVVAGDLYLEDVREYRTSVIESAGARALFPLWRRDPDWLARWFLSRGSQAVVTAVDTTQLDASFAGRRYDESFLEDLPDTVGPCGERGAFHTFVTHGSAFREAVPVSVGSGRSEGRMSRVPLRSADG